MRVLRRCAWACLLLVALAGAAADYLAPHGYATQFREHPGEPPSQAFPLGTDELGRDAASRLLHGSRVSLLLAPAAALLSTLIAALVGGLAGSAGGRLEALLLRATDLILSLPWLFLLLLVRAALPLNVPPFHSLVLTFLLLGLLGWAAPARIVAGAARSLRRQDFVLQARAAGCGGGSLLIRHILPNLRPVLAAQFWTSIPIFILSEANLGMLGLGVGEPLPSWGGLLRQLESYPAVESNIWLLAPLALLILVVGCFHLLVPLQGDST